ncbi:hypothetical protein [Neobacillus massiliamazoniensis]|uniref:Uncharacterized protein n=1 Tax=Neobacillus massiliamazoniensis TaxID=1499688 RepID=A0A0U1NQM3_9BACI|nr:hypothetical protein [Neobacillus massiliamazoniensis]CRK80334.1 hypothetical protein; phage SPbeta [Neobacillus massiliamazoniensis]
MLYYLGICLIIWLSVGFIFGLKFIFIDKKFTQENIEERRKNMSLDEDDDKYNLFVKNKYTFLAMTTLAGFIPLVADIYGSIKYR